VATNGSRKRSRLRHVLVIVKYPLPGAYGAAALLRAQLLGLVQGAARSSHSGHGHRDHAAESERSKTDIYRTPRQDSVFLAGKRSRILNVAGVEEPPVVIGGSSPRPWQDLSQARH